MKRKAEHTKGPWITHPIFPEWVIPAKDRLKKIGASVDRKGDRAEFAQAICMIRDEHRHRSVDEQKANARLIASAPDMLERLAQIAEIIEKASVRERHDLPLKATYSGVTMAEFRRILRLAKGRK